MNLKRLVIAAAGTLVLTTFGSAGPSFAAHHHSGLRLAASGISVTIGIPAPPMIRYSFPPELVVIPGTNVYFVPSNGINVLFYHGFWWRSYRGYWYQSRAYNGPWRHIHRTRVPGVFFGLPHGYRNSYSHHHRIHYRDVQHNWHRWEKERYWQRNHYTPPRSKYRQERREYRRDYRQERRHDRREFRRDQGRYLRGH